MKSKIIKMLSCLLFFSLLLGSYLSVTNLFRNAGNDRLRITGLYEEGPLDMIYIGGSSAFVYWQPLKAWHDCGFTSYSYATNSLEADARLYYMKEALRSHKPQMFVIEMRDFQILGGTVYEAGMRNGSDSMDVLSPVRIEYIYNYVSKRKVPKETDLLSLYLDISKYHANKQNLSYPEAWEYIDNRSVCHNKGWEWVDAWGYVEEPAGFETSVRAGLDDRTMSALKELLEFCREQDMEVLFVTAPFAPVTANQEALFNTIGDTVNSYGYRFLNTNDYYKEMNLDFSRDFYNEGHVNLFGAEKYTAFIEAYIKEHYDLPDHHGDPEYESWNEEYKRFAQEEKEHKATVENLIQNAAKGREIAAKIKKTDDLSKWMYLSEDERFTILIAQSGQLSWPEDLEGDRILQRLGFSREEHNGIRVIGNTSVIYSNQNDGMKTYEGSFRSGPYAPSYTYTIEAGGAESSIKIDGLECSLKKTGLNVVVADNHYGDVIDSINITSRNGKLVFDRE